MPSLAASVASRMRTGCSVRVAWNASLKLLALVGVHAAIELREPVPADARLPRAAPEPELGVAVLGEDDDALVGPVCRAAVAPSQ